MSWQVILTEALAFAALFTVLVFVGSSGERKYSAAGIHNYPPGYPPKMTAACGDDLIHERRVDIDEAIR